MPQKPYSFVSLPKDFHTQSPVWHDGSCSQTRLSGEIRFELQNLTPLLVGWERQKLNDTETPWKLPVNLVNENDARKQFVEKAARAVYLDAQDQDDEKRAKKQEQVEKSRREYIKRVQDHIVDVQVQKAGWSIDAKSALCPLRAPWEHRPVLIPGDSLKGLLRHELGALLGAPMERVAERSYSYRPNLVYPLEAAGRRLEPRLARVPTDGIVFMALDDTHQVRVPTKLELFPADLQYNKKARNFDYLFDQPYGAPYRGGQGAGQKLNSKPQVHRSLKVIRTAKTEDADVPHAAQDGYLATLRHLTDTKHGHFCEQRHPDVPKVITADNALQRILKAAKEEVFQPGDLVWVEWDTSKKQIVSFGWHYYYRWAYQDSVRRIGGAAERKGLFPLREEKGDKPEKLSAVRRLFGYAADDNNDGVKGIGKGNHSQLMGRISVNAAIEVIEPGKEDEDARFEEPIFLKELGQPKPSAVENYLKQPYHPNRNRPGDTATLLTYGDAAGYDTPGQLAGRKFYLDRADAYEPYSTPNKIAPWKDAKESNRLNDRSTLAIDVSKPKHRFRFTLRFRDLDMDELAAVLLALCPNQFAKTVGGTHKDGYCSKLGYGRPLGLGTVRIEAKELHFLEHDANGNSTLKPESVSAWFGNHVKLQSFPVLTEWLNVHQHKHQQGQDYERDPDDNEIFTVHTKLRAKHSTKQRRYK